MNVQASGVVMMGLCSIKGPHCTAARTAAPVTVVWEVESRRQIDVCRACFKQEVEDGSWHTNYSFELKPAIRVG